MDEAQLIVLKGEVEPGEPIVFYCSVNEGSFPITYKFYKEKESKPFYQDTINATQIMWHKTTDSKEYEGQYYCTASNRANLSKHVIQSNTLTVRGKSSQQQNAVQAASSRPESTSERRRLGT